MSPREDVEKNSKKSAFDDSFEMEEEGPEDESRKRDEWASPLEFLFTSISMSVGLGNIWRFPFTAYENGGGAFLVPYFIVLFVIGRPMYFLELVLGQFSSYGPVKIWEMAPILRGVGYGELIASIYGHSYYVAIMATTLYYLIASFQSVLPWSWSACDPSWAMECPLESGRSVHHGNNSKSLPELYYENHVTKQKSQIDDGIGAPDLHLSLCLIGAWILLFFTLVRGVRSSGKVAYFTALFPYVVLFTLLVRGLTLDGGLDGIYYFIKPQWSRLADHKVWYAAVVQCFFSLGPGFGPIISNASYNKFRHNIYRDATIISLLDTFTSLLAGCTIFSVLGHLAFKLDVDIQNVARGGPGLAFVSYPEAISQFEAVPQVFAVLFFFMMLTLGIGTCTSVINGIISVICDQFLSVKRIYVTTGVCIMGCGLGFMYLTPGGGFMITLVDYFGSGSVIYVMATLEVIGVALVYGLRNFCKDIEFMLDIKIGWYWKICWGYIVPIGLPFIFLFTLFSSERVTHNGADFPEIAIICGWILFAVALLPIPICALYAICTSREPTLSKKWKEACMPSMEWGPRDLEERQDWQLFKQKSR